MSIGRRRLVAIWRLIGFVVAKPAMACTTVFLGHGEQVVVAMS